MKTFNLEKALSGEKVITRDGHAVTEITKFNTRHGDVSLVAVVNGKLTTSYDDGKAFNSDAESKYDLFMAPKKLSGFVNVYRDGDATILGSVYDGKVMCKRESCMAKYELIMIIDLSQFEEGGGL